MFNRVSHLLARDEPVPFLLENAGGACPIVLICEHGGRYIPRSLGQLGLTGRHLSRHFMWDIGALALSRALVKILDAPLIHQPYSRMICDCNRFADTPSFIPRYGEGVPVPGNIGLTQRDIGLRRSIIWQFFHRRLADFLDGRQQAGQATILIAIHSFTPVFHGQARLWHVGVLHDQRSKIADDLLIRFKEKSGYLTGDNQPYKLGNNDEYTIPVHGLRRNLPSCAIEIRNDLLRDNTGVSEWSHYLAGALSAVI